MKFSTQYLSRIWNGIKHRVYGRFGKDTSQDDFLSTLSLLFPRRYTGECIRLGGTGDGAYVVPNDLVGIDASISPGVSSEIEFDLELGKRGIYSYMYDASVDRPSNLGNHQLFVPKFIDSFESDTTTTLDRIVERVRRSHSGDLMLQMDIEGAEYRCLSAVSEDVLKQFRIVVIEFHDVDVFMSNDLYVKNWIRPIFEKLTRYHDVVHVHANNWSRVTQCHGIGVPSLLEVTYLRRDRWVDAGELKTVCRELDVLSNPDLPAITLSSPWFDKLDPPSTSK
jgi:hypothetical protein